jgi:hypothetical protein
VPNDTSGGTVNRQPLGAEKSGPGHPVPIFLPQKLVSISSLQTRKQEPGGQAPIFLLVMRVKKALFID